VKTKIKIPKATNTEILNITSIVYVIIKNNYEFSAIPIFDIRVYVSE